MFYIKGELERKLENSVVIETNDIGREAFVSAKTLEKLGEIGERVKIYTYEHNKDDGVVLYGFLSAEELLMFRALITVSGVGPKSALALLSVMDPEEIASAVSSEDDKALARAQGVGKKAAQRIILELKEKMAHAPTVMGKRSARQDAVDALTALGFSHSEALKGVMETAMDGMSAEQIIKQTLSVFSS
ncbi:MAG: Holliday junction branch migration protein RuvA [Clostridiales bacterium]|jgi:Holliday junction DNA helicase RuvA|nr:Holliday junction branch migration protein RuvA [Clostridiales bacterium]